MRFHSTPIEEHAEVPLADGGRWEQLVAHWTQLQQGESSGATHTGGEGNACYVLSVHRPAVATATGDPTLVPTAELEEITALVQAQGDRVVGRETYVLSRPDARTLIRSGVAERLGRQARSCGADMLVVDAELSPSQTRNLEDATGLPVCDREGVILNVFQRHATTRRSRIQVELAHLQYLRPRIRGIGLDMDQQAGGIVGARGAGETASELLARRIDGRLAELRRRLAQLQRADAARRKHRVDCARVALVGYTNAGKTSLMNALTSAGLSARDRPFETLDTTSRCLSRHGGDVLLSDTVGFIRRLPERLFASFASTLAEVAEASLLLVVVDASDPELREHLDTTDHVLRQLGATDVPRLVVFNKLDRLPTPMDEDTLSALGGGHPHTALSAHDPAAVAALRRRLMSAARTHQQRRQVFVPYAMPDLDAITRSIYADCRVVQAHACPTGIQYLIEGPAHIVADIAQTTRSKRR